MNRKLTGSPADRRPPCSPTPRSPSLGTVFNYPDILKEPADDILVAFRASQDGRGRLVRRARPLRRTSSRRSPSESAGSPTHRAMRVAVPVGIAAAVVQVIGLSRWPLLVPEAAPPTRPVRDPVRSPPPRRESFATRSPDPRQPDRGDLRLPVHRRLDRCWSCVALSRSDRRPLVHRAGRGRRGARSWPGCCPR